ncbi:MAG: hypothetical protein M3Q42_11890 [Pseudomonadota bacterium]|nr:hypothetical protein [Pseudomonadota bacterium]
MKYAGKICLLLVALVCSCVCSEPAEAGWGNRTRWQSQPQFLEHIVVEQPMQHAAGQMATTPVQHSSRLDRKMDGSSGYNSDRVTDLPTGEQELYFSLTVGDNWLSDNMQSTLVSWFENDPRIVRVREQTHFNSYTPSNPHFRDQLRNSYGDAVPMVTLQDHTGALLLHLTRPTVAKIGSPGELADLIDDALYAKFAPPRFDAGGRSLVVKDTSDDCGPYCPTPLKQPDIDPSQTMPEVRPPSRVGPGLELTGYLLFLVLCVVVGGVFLVCRFKPSASYL